MKAKTPPDIVLRHLQENYRYDPETGEFWRRAGMKHSLGYIHVAGTLGAGAARTRWCVKAHRLAYFFMEGRWPDDEKNIDHINCDKADNRWSNLRLCSRAQNAQNQRGRGKIKSRGVNLVQPYRKAYYTATIGTYPNNEFLGCFNTERDAAEAYNKAAIKRYGEFARLNVVDT